MGCTLDFESQFARDGSGGGGVFGGGGPGGNGSGGIGATGDTTLVGDVLRFGEQTDAHVQDLSTDAFVTSDDPEQNFGSSGSLYVKAGEFVSLLRFDISDLPDDPTGAELSLYVPHKEGSSDLVEVHLVLEAWDEGDGADIGACSWLMRTEAEPWSSVGVGPNGSRGSEVLAMFAPSQDRERYRIVIPKDTVKDWYKTPIDNFGIALVGIATDPEDPDAVGFVSSEHGSDGSRPFLDVSF